MQITSSSAAASSGALQALRELFQTQKTTEAAGETGQTLPTAGAKGPPPAPPPGPPPAGMNGGGFSTDTMSSLLEEQEDTSSLSSNVVEAADTNGDGTVSLDELAASLGSDATGLADAFARVDTDADGQIDEAEMSAGLEANRPGRRPHGPPPTASDTALNLLAAADADGDGGLSLAETATALGAEDETTLSDVFAALDADGDGSLGSEELTSAIQSMMSRQLEAYAVRTTQEPGATYAVAA